jgi:hypothetical protein
MGRLVRFIEQKIEGTLLNEFIGGWAAAYEWVYLKIYLKISLAIFTHL